MRSALTGGGVVGSPQGEGWGRLFVATQVGRWITGEAPVGRADLLAWPHGRPFWPVDPVVQAVQAPLALAAGDMAAFALVAALLLALAGVGPYRLARAAGAARGAALAAGLAVQLSPYLLRNLHDGVLEVIAAGPLALAAEAVLACVRAPSRARLVAVGVAVSALGGTAPYFAVYLALCCLAAAAWTWRRWPTWMGVAGVGAVACALALAPLLATESGPDGRLGPRWRGTGYREEPGELVTADGAPWRPSQSEMPARPPGARPPADSPWLRGLRRTPGGATLGAVGLAGLIVPAARPWTILAAALWTTGPGPGLAARAAGAHGQPVGPLDRLLASVPLTSSMGNPGRLLIPYAIAAAVAGALALGRRWLPAALFAAAALGEAWLAVPALALPATPDGSDAAVLASLDGPTIVFPTGDAPYWHPRVGPKEALFLAGRAGVPVAGNYGRGGLPADLPVQVLLARASGVPLARQAWESAAALHEDPAAARPSSDFACLLVLEDRLGDDARTALRTWLVGHARLRAEGPRTSAWSLVVTAPRERPERSYGTAPGG